jgi:hypothetical protein
MNVIFVVILLLGCWRIYKNLRLATETPAAAGGLEGTEKRRRFLPQRRRGTEEKIRFQNLRFEILLCVSVPLWFIIRSVFFSVNSVPPW